MNRFAYSLSTSSAPTKFIGLFPWGTVIDSVKTDHKKDEIHFLEEGISFLQELSRRNIAVVMFINQFKPHPIPMEKLKDFAEAVEGFIKAQNVNLAGVYWAPGYDKKDPFVVPNPGMFIRVTENLGTNWEGVEVLSNSDVDLSAAIKVNAKPIKIGGAHTKYTSFNTLNDWLSSF